MSSSKYFADLPPDPRLRRLVQLSGIVLAMLGVLLVLTLPLRPMATIPSAGAWLSFCVREFILLRRGFALCCRIRIMADGALRVLGPDGNWRVARLASGTVVLRRYAWIRCRIEAGQYCAELVRGNCRQSHDWRRLQVIWRHVGGAL